MSRVSNIQSTYQLFQALRTIIPNIPEHHVQELTIKCGPMDDIPTLHIITACAGADGNLMLEGPEGGERVKIEARTFNIVPVEP